jgi:hypothetical protein
MKSQKHQVSFLVIDETEMEDFARVVREEGLSPDDFEVTEEVGEPYPVGIEGLHCRKAKATVTRVKSGACRTYRAGYDGTAWVAEFREDLRSKAFGDPPPR